MAGDEPVPVRGRCGAFGDLAAGGLDRGDHRRKRAGQDGRHRVPVGGGIPGQQHSSPAAIAPRPAGNSADLASTAADRAADEPTRAPEAKRTPADWNGTDYYVLLEDDIPRWDDAREKEYVYAGGGKRCTTPLFRLEPGARVFVHLGHHGYVAAASRTRP